MLTFSLRVGDDQTIGAILSGVLGVLACEEGKTTLARHLARPFLTVIALDLHCVSFDVSTLRVASKASVFRCRRCRTSTND